MMQPPPAPTDPTLRFPLGGRRAWSVWAVALSVYILAVFHRTSLGVAGLVAAERFHISSAELATFTMVQLFVYAGMQIPVGALLDRFGSRRLLITGVVLMTGAQAGFAFADTFPAGVAARVVLGAGDAMVFVSLIRLVAMWFPPARTPMVTQVTGLLGQVGALLAAAPLSAMLHGLGWTWSFLIAAGAGVVLGTALVLTVRDSPYEDPHREQVRLRAVARALGLAWRTPGTRLGLWAHFTAPFSTNVFTLLWGFPFLVAGQGLSPSAASNLLMLMVVTAVLFSPVAGMVTVRFPFFRSTLVLAIVAVMVAMWTVVLLWPGRAPLWLLILLVVTTAAGGPGSMVAFDVARTFNPPTRLGSATGIVNTGGFIATLGAVVLIGLVLDHVAPGGPATYTLDSFRAAMSVQYLIWALGITQIVRYRRKARRHLAHDDPGLYDALRQGGPAR